MGRPRSDLQTLLKGITPKVYFQPPATVVMEYPCIVYKRDDILKTYADDAPYNRTKRYLLTVIDKDPDSVIVEQISALPQCRFSRAFSVDNLNHDVFTIYF